MDRGLIMLLLNSKKNYENIITQIKNAKNQKKNFISIKVFQIDYDSGKPHTSTVLAGASEGGEIQKNLTELGYNISFTETNKRTDLKTGKSIPIFTKNMIIRW